MEMVLQQQSRTTRWGSSSNSGVVSPPVPMKKEAELGEEQEDIEVGGGGGELLLRRGPWTVDEDLTLINYIAEHGEGRWNALARAAGLKRTGKSCRLRWLNYLRPDVKRGDFTADEQLLILDLHSRWGNRWSKIAAQLPGRTDNEIKNYWRTRVQKHAKRLNCDAGSARFKDTIAAFLWAPPQPPRLGGSPSLCGRVPSTLLSSSSSSPPVTADNNNFSYDDSSPSSAVTTTTTGGGNNAAATTATATPSSSSATSTSSFALSNQYSVEELKPSGETVSCEGDWWTAQGAADHEGLIWSSMAPATQQMNVDDQFHDLQDLSGWVQGFSDEGISGNNLWSLEDVWRMQ